MTNAMRGACSRRAVKTLRILPPSSPAANPFSSCTRSVIECATTVSRYGFDELGATTLAMVADPSYLAIRIYRAVGFTGGETQLQAEKPPPRSG